MKLAVVITSALAIAEAAPLKVILMAGQSNMQGHGYVDYTDKSKTSNKGTLEGLVKSQPKEYGKLKDGEKWATRKDVWIYYNDIGSLNGPQQESKAGEWYGDLTVGYAGNGGKGEPVGHTEMGPELGFGWVVGDAIDDQVLLLKTAWGGKDLDVDFRPPSRSGGGHTTGYFYTKMVNTVRDTLKKLPSLFPSYSGSYELSGFVWHQGWNDACGQVGGGPDSKNCKSKHHCFKPDPSKYEEDLVALIKDVRKEFSDLPGGGKLPFSVGVSGMEGYTNALVNDSLLLDPQVGHIDLAGVGDNLKNHIIPAQLAVGDEKKHPEFKGTVLSAETRNFYRSKDDSPGNQIYHWHNNCESYWLVGKAMGENMLKLMHSSKHDEVVV